VGEWIAIHILVSAQFAKVLDSSEMNVSISQIVKYLGATGPGRPARDHRLHARHGRVHA